MGSVRLEAILLTVRVSDVERSLRFYRDQLGLPLVHVDGSFHEFDAGPVRLAIDTGGVAGGRKGADRCPVEIHLRVEEIAAVRTSLEAQGVSFEGPTGEYPYGKLARFYDPEGNPLLLYEPGQCPLQAASQKAPD